jgi:CRP-like cAMP-binding protein
MLGAQKQAAMKAAGCLSQVRELTSNFGDSVMMDLVVARASKNDEVLVAAVLHGSEVDFYVSREAIEDYLGLTDATLSKCIDELQQNWERFADPLGRLVHDHGKGVHITNEMLKP